MFQILGALLRRVQRKCIVVAPIVVGALVLIGVLSIVTAALEPWLPAALQHMLQQARHGDWASSRASLMSLFDGYGHARNVVFLLLQILQVVIAPIPAPLVGLLGGSLFGFWEGLLLSLLGLVIGSAIAMMSSRVLGDMVVRKVVPSPILARFDHLVGANDLWSFFLIFLLPVFPDDAICFMAGLTRLPLHRLMIVCTLGRLPGIAVLTFAGSSVGGDSTHAYLVLGAAMILAFGVWLFSEELEAALRKTLINQPKSTSTQRVTGRTEQHV